MADLFVILPEAILYIIYGFLFIQVYRLKVVSPKSDGPENTLISSLVVGFMIYKAMEVIHLTTKSYYMLIICVICIIGGYICASIYMSNGVQKFINKKLNIHKTFDTYIWDVVTSEKEPIMIRIRTQDDEYIEGFVNLAEENTDDPHLTIGNYIIYKMNDSNRNIIVSARPNELLMFDLKNAKYYEFVFDKNHNFKNLVSLNNLMKSKYYDEQD